jgi:hypothetical protein
MAVSSRQPGVVVPGLRNPAVVVRDSPVVVRHPAVVVGHPAVMTRLPEVVRPRVVVNASMVMRLPVVVRPLVVARLSVRVRPLVVRNIPVGAGLAVVTGSHVVAVIGGGRAFERGDGTRQRDEESNHGTAAPPDGALGAPGIGGLALATRVHTLLQSAVDRLVDPIFP